jgi:hypothetical protein
MPGNNEVIAVTHTPDSFNNLTLIIFYDLDSLEVLLNRPVRMSSCQTIGAH